MSNTNLNEAVIEEFMEGETRAEEWRLLRQALQDRLRFAVDSRDLLPEGDPERTALEVRVAELRQQVTALAEEEAITQFVEDSVRSSLNKPARPGGMPDEFDYDDTGY